MTLQGNVDTVPQNRIAAWVASGLVGVQVVINQIQVTPEARSDRETAFMKNGWRAIWRIAPGVSSKSRISF